jgi:hypothetical protein
MPAIGVRRYFPSGRIKSRDYAQDYARDHAPKIMPQDHARKHAPGIIGLNIAC